jgi:hypothetical protein
MPQRFPMTQNYGSRESKHIESRFVFTMARVHPRSSAQAASGHPHPGLDLSWQAESAVDTLPHAQRLGLVSETVATKFRALEERIGSFIDEFPDEIYEAELQSNPFWEEVRREASLLLEMLGVPYQEPPRLNVFNQ